MKISKVMLASVFLTAALLAVVSGMVTKGMAERSAVQAPAATQDVQVYQQREAQYQQLVAQANQQLEQANADLKLLQNQVSDLRAQTNPVQSPTLNPGISAEKAGQIAEAVAGLGQMVQKTAELVNFQGKAAYEAVFEKGSIYIDAQSGAVLFNGTIPQQITLARAAQVAAEYLKNSDVLQTDQITFRNAAMYRVIFKDGTMVYMDTTGQITYIQKASPNGVSVEQANASSTGGKVPESAKSSEHDDGN